MAAWNAGCGRYGRHASKSELPERGTDRFQRIPQRAPGCRHAASVQHCPDPAPRCCLGRHEVDEVVAYGPQQDADVLSSVAAGLDHGGVGAADLPPVASAYAFPSHELAPLSHVDPTIWFRRLRRLCRKGQDHGRRRWRRPAAGHTQAIAPHEPVRQAFCKAMDSSRQAWCSDADPRAKIMQKQKIAWLASGATAQPAPSG